MLRDVAEPAVAARAAGGSRRRPRLSCLSSISAGTRTAGRHIPGLRASRAGARPPPAAPIFQRRPASPTPNTTTHTPSFVILFCKCGARALERPVPWARRVAVRSPSVQSVSAMLNFLGAGAPVQVGAQAVGLRARASASERVWPLVVTGSAADCECTPAAPRRGRMDGRTDLQGQSEGTLRKRAIQRGDEVSLLILK